MIIDRLHEAACDSPVCVGLDTRIEYLPEYLASNAELTPGEKITEFNKRIIDATADLAACYKIQIACYEALGLDGMKAYADTSKYAREAGRIVIGDAKRGDIMSTAGEYAKGHFTGDFETDFLTVNPYMGEDAISPYYPYVKDHDKGLFVLLHTSNPSAQDFQEDKLHTGQALYEKVADSIEKWGRPFVGDSGFSSIGAVDGLTYPEAFESLQTAHPNMFFLVPGYGAQGGSGKDVAEIYGRGRCAVVNNSRGIITAHKGKAEDASFVDPIRQKTLEMKEDIFQWL